jgi:hypothetical protein
MGAKTGLVGHLRALGDPVAQIEIGQLELAGLLDLPEHAVGAVAARRVRVVEGVDRRQAIGQDVDDGDHAQDAGALFGWLPELHQAGVDAALQQKLGVLVHAVLVHAAASVAGGLVTQVQRVMFFRETQPGDTAAQLLMRRTGPALAAVGLEALHRDAQRHAGLALVAMGAVGEQAAAAEAAGHQGGIGFSVDQVAGRGHLGTRRLVRQVAARVGRRGVELQRGERKLFRVGHGMLGGQGGTAMPSRAQWARS